MNSTTTPTTVETTPCVQVYVVAWYDTKADAIDGSNARAITAAASRQHAERLDYPARIRSIREMWVPAGGTLHQAAIERADRLS